MVSSKRIEFSPRPPRVRLSTFPVLAKNFGASPERRDLELIDRDPRSRLSIRKHSTDEWKR